MEQYKVEERFIYNMDEKGFLIGIVSKIKRIFSRRLYEEGGVKKLLQDGNREWITTIAAICADGTVLSPGLIYQATTGFIQDSWLQDFDPILHNCFFASSPAGWTNDHLGYQWLTQIFDRETRDKARRAWRLLILDGHRSYVSMRFIDFCDRNRILLALYPPHSTHTLQPLDVCLFRPLSQAYSNELTKFMDDCQGFSSITKRDFFRLFWLAWEASFTPKNIYSGFEATSLSPFNPERVISKFTRKQPERPSSSSSTGSAIKAEDWKRIEKLLRSTVSDMYDKKAKKLSNTIHALSMENILLRMQNDALQKSFLNEKKRRKRGKPLTLDFPTYNEGGAIFYSPTKIQQARDRQDQKDAEVETKRHQKEANKALKDAEKIERARVIEERKAARENTRQLKLQQLKEKRRQKDEDHQAKLANQQLQKELYSRAKNVKKPPQQQMLAYNGDNQDLEVVEEEEPPPPTNARGRQIRLPERFRPIK